MSRYRFIEAQRSQYPVRLLCQVIAVPASGYCAWQQVIVLGNKRKSKEVARKNLLGKQR